MNPKSLPKYSVVWGLGFQIYGAGLGCPGLRLRYQRWDSGFRVQGLGLGDTVFGCRAQGFGFRILFEGLESSQDPGVHEVAAEVVRETQKPWREWQKNCGMKLSSLEWRAEDAECWMQGFKP